MIPAPGIPWALDTCAESLPPLRALLCAHAALRVPPRATLCVLFPQHTLFQLLEMAFCHLVGGETEASGG